MKKPFFFRLGHGIYRHRVAILFFWSLLIVACIPTLPYLTNPFQSTGFVVTDAPSTRTNAFLNRYKGYHEHPIIVLYHSQRLLTTDDVFQQRIKQSLSGLDGFKRKHEIIYPNQNNQKQWSKDKHTAYAVILFKKNQPMSPATLKAFKTRIQKPKNMDMWFGGDAIFVDSVNQQTQKDLFNADAVAAPLSIIVLLLVFGTLVAACVPMILGGGCAIMMLAGLYTLAHIFHLSIFTLNIALLLGLCLSLDYSLFIIYRFREELHKNKNVPLAIANTLEHAGKAIFFSGLAVFISLSALLLFPINILFSVGIGGLMAVFIAAMVALTLLPAVLSILQHRINAIAFRGLFPREKTSLWHRLAVMVVHRPIVFFIITLAILLCLGSPFLHARFGLSDENVLSDHSENQQFFDAYHAAFHENELTPIMLVLKKKQGNILSENNLKHVVRFVDKLQTMPNVDRVDSLVTTSPKLSASEYSTLYHLPKKQQNPDIKRLLKTTTGKHFTVMEVISRYNGNAPETRELIKKIRMMNPGEGWTLQLTGIPVNNLEVIESIAKHFPYALAWIMGFTYLILLLLLRSVFLPFKAIIMNLLSLCASYGVLVFVFQEGHFHTWLNFHVQGMLDLSLLVIIFCALFGFSMDYEVFLLTRIQEHYLKTQNNDESIVFGIVKSSRIISSAALIVICLCGSFMMANVLMVKAFGLGIAVAIFVDAFIIRTLLVPSTMSLLKKWNWYFPGEHALNSVSQPEKNRVKKRNKVIRRT